MATSLSSMLKLRNFVYLQKIDRYLKNMGHKL